MSHVTLLTRLWLVSLIFDALFFLSTTTIPILSYKAYRFFRQEKFRVYSFGFSFIAASFFAHGMAMLNKYVIAHTIHATTLEDLELLFGTALTLQVLANLFFILGLALLIIVYLNVRDTKTGMLLTLLALFGATATLTKPILLGLLIILLLSFITVCLATRYHKRKNKVLKWTTIGFALLLTAETIYTFLVATLPWTTFRLPDEAWFVSSVFLIAGFLAINYSFFRVLKPWRNEANLK